MIFISYRIADSNDLVCRLDRDLTEAFGERAVFRDKSRLEGGTKWATEIEHNAKTRRVMLAVIGPKWQAVTFETGRRKGFPRLSDPKDWVRKEITLAFAAGRVVIPILLNDTLMPDRPWLATCKLGSLADQQGLPIRSDEYDYDLGKLVQLLREVCPELPLSAGRPESRIWCPAVLYPLQPAPHFAGRTELLAYLIKWATNPTDRAHVVALVAAGGTGKTALAERVLNALTNYSAAGVFVWSFYENPQTEAFLRAACRYFTGSEPKETGGLLERLQQAISTLTPHLFILDGLELMQATGKTGRVRGELEDPLLRRFLRWLAAGHGTSVKALITSRFPLPDLFDWKSDRYQDHDLSDLDPPAARAIFRKWKVRGTDNTLNKLASDVHYHALTIDILGSYLGIYCNGNPRKAPHYDPKDWTNTDPKAAKLNRVLTSYSEKLTEKERDLLARLSLFPRGVSTSILRLVVSAGKSLSGALHQCSGMELRQLLERLKSIGLVFSYFSKNASVFTAHPFLRAFFEKLVNVHDPKEIHNAVRSVLMHGLETRPDAYPECSKDLDRYEQLIELTRLAGKLDEAYDLFTFGLGGYDHLGQTLGEFARGHRIAASLYAVAKKTHELPALSFASLVNAMSIFELHLGDLDAARAHFTALRKKDQNRYVRDSAHYAIMVEIHAGRWAVAEKKARYALNKTRKSVWEYSRHQYSKISPEDFEDGFDELLSDYLSQNINDDENDDRVTNDHEGKLEDGYVATQVALGFALFALGRRHEAASHLMAATRRSFKASIFCRDSILEAECSILHSRKKDAHARLIGNRVLAAENAWAHSESLCEVLLGFCCLEENVTQATRHLKFGRNYTSHSDDVEMALRCYHLAARIARYEQKVERAVIEATNGIQLADSCGLGRWSIDIRLELGMIHLAAGRPQEVIGPVAKALEMSEHPECQYAWAIADGLHYLGIANARLGDTSTAHEFFRRAVATCRRLEHPRLKESEEELRRIVHLES